MGTENEKSLRVIFIALIAGFAFLGTLTVGTGQTSAEVTGVIESDTTWTKANSPYNLTGNVAVEKGVTLTIEPGVIINLERHYLRVNGTLIARASSNDNIYFNGPSTYGIMFNPSSTGWNEQTGTGCIIENAIITCRLSIGGVSPLINKNTFSSSITISGGSPIISKNTIIGYNAGADWSSGTYGIKLGVGENAALIFDNTFSGSFGAAIQIEGGSPTVERNQISNDDGYVILIHYTNYAHEATHPLIQKNTITKNANGISFRGNSNPTLVNNNFEDNSNYNLRLGLGTQVNIDASYNWWGTTDTSEIDEKIYDYNDDFDLGKVNYTPFLTAANPQAAPDPNAPTPTAAPTPPPTDSPSTSPTPSQEPTQTEFEAIIGVAIVALVLGAGLGLLIYLVKRK